jgi:aryl-alcohol dehydrogenase-like predicted oxidoreductase
MTSVTDTLALGTAQLGQPYGIANRIGQPDERTADAVLELAWRLGVRYFDTAQAYGESEAIIGRFLQGNPEPVATEMRVVTKLHPGADVTRAGAVHALLEGSWERLGRQSVWGALLHRENLLDQWHSQLGETLREWRARGRIRHLGVSVHSVEGMARAIETPGIEIIQAPLSPFDRRMRSAGLLAGAEAAGKKLFLRSVFLQGLIVLEPGEAAHRLPLAAGAVMRLAAFCAEHRIDRRRFAVGYVRHLAPKALLVIGSETPVQVMNNCAMVTDMQGDSRLYEEWDDEWSSDDPLLVNPHLWPSMGVRS